MTKEQIEIVTLPMDYSILKSPNTFRETKRIFLLDIDNTLYKENNGMDTEIKEKITEFGALYDEKTIAAKKMTEYYIKYGHTLRGYLIENKQCRLRDWKNVYDKVNIEKHLKHDQELEDMLIEFKKENLLIAFTNGDYDIGSRMLKSLGYFHIFDGIMYCEYKDGGDFLCKPDIAVYEIIEEYFCGKELHIFEDRMCNLEVPMTRNWHTHYVTVENDIKKIFSNFMPYEATNQIRKNKITMP